MPAWRALTVLAVAALAGCASTPQATPERDAEARRFNANPGAATIYVYRPDFPNMDENDPVLYVGDRLIGAVLAGTFFRFDVRAGTHILRSYTHDIGSLKIDTHSGELHYVSLSVAAGHSRLALAGPAAAKREILLCCALMENWAKGQRPLQLLR